MIEINYYLAVGFGCIVYLLLQLNGVFNLPYFKWTIFIKTNIVPTILNLFIGWFLVLARKDLENFYPITLFSAFILGVSGQAILKKLMNMFDKDNQTVIGLNQ
jgi:hypothetical protein